MKKLNQINKADHLYTDLDAEKVIQNFSSIIKFDTVGYADTSKIKKDEFIGVHKFLETAYPLCNKAMEKEVISELSLLYKWPGSGSDKLPIMLMAHIDVVPAITGSGDKWDHEPFSGHIDDKYVWGRGTLDTKNLITAYMDAAEYLLGKGFTPDRDIYFCFEQDEETMGGLGSAVISKMLEERGVKLEFVLDEGGEFADGAEFGAPGVTLATMGVFEKGYVDIHVTSDSRGGHSSAPGKSTSLGRVSTAISAIEHNQFEADICPPLEKLLLSIKDDITVEPLAGYMKDYSANKQKIADYLCLDDSLAPLVHTTTAPTMISGGSPAPNVLTQMVQATVNFRIAAGMTAEMVEKHCQDVTNSDEVTCKMDKFVNPSNISKIEGESYDFIKEAIEDHFAEVKFVPTLMVGGTDARFFENICECCYRIPAIYQDPELFSTIHAANERCEKDGYVYSVKLFISIIEKACK